MIYVKEKLISTTLSFYEVEGILEGNDGSKRATAVFFLTCTDALVGACRLVDWHFCSVIVRAISHSSSQVTRTI
jgi:hypothetical protein